MRRLASPEQDKGSVIVRAQLAHRQRRGAHNGNSTNLRRARRRPAYVARLLALGHQLRGVLDSGGVEGVGELARRLGVTQPRVTQILNLTHLCPAIQREILSLEAVDGVEPMTERPLREVLREVSWVGQWRRWSKHRERFFTEEPEHLSERRL